VLRKFLSRLVSPRVEPAAEADAETALRRELAADPSSERAHAALFDLLQSRGDVAGALVHLEALLRKRPDWVEALYNYGCLLVRTGRGGEAESAFRRVIALDPRYERVYRMLGSLLHRAGRIQELLEMCRAARRHLPDAFDIESFELFGSNFVDEVAAEELSAKHRAFGARLEASVAERFSPFANVRDLGRRLKIGYVSGDLSFHPVALFLHPLLERHDRAQFDVHCYSVGTTADEMTRRIRDASACWRDVRSLTEAQLAEAVHRDGIDILVDLSGHSGISRLGTFAQRPAPVQAGWLGYLNTTGLTRIQYRISDSCCDPPGLTEHLHTEKLVRLPHTQWCYRPFLDAEPAATRPHAADGRITFGVFTQPAKSTEAMRVVWQRLLAAVPDSQLVVAGIVDDRAGAALLEAFSHAGIARSRIDLLPFLPVRDYYRAFDRVDIALDTSPYSGGTTTCDALWMGVPVLTLAGERPASRSAASILTSLGLTEWIAVSPEDYLQRAIRFARDPSALAQLRRSLRGRMLASPLMQEERFARDIEAAYRTMWRDWCASAGA
jgi:predicted O-linked N-acetylglucosamine transferase (SPINDLY family)